VALQRFSLLIEWCKTEQISVDGFENVDSILELWMLSNQYNIPDLSIECQRRLLGILEQHHLEQLEAFENKDKDKSGNGTQGLISSRSKSALESSRANQTRAALLSSLFQIFESGVPYDMKKFCATVLVEDLDRFLPSYEGDKEVLT